jgi:hypothetical protein
MVALADASSVILVESDCSSDSAVALSSLTRASKAAELPLVMGVLTVGVLLEYNNDCGENGVAHSDLLLGVLGVVGGYGEVTGDAGVFGGVAFEFLVLKGLCLTGDASLSSADRMPVDIIAIKWLCTSFVKDMIAVICFFLSSPFTAMHKRLDSAVFIREVVMDGDDGDNADDGDDGDDDDDDDDADDRSMNFWRLGFGPLRDDLRGFVLVISSLILINSSINSSV